MLQSSSFNKKKDLLTIDKIFATLPIELQSEIEQAAIMIEFK